MGHEDALLRMPWRTSTMLYRLHLFSKSFCFHSLMLCGQGTGTALHHADMLPSLNNSPCISATMHPCHCFSIADRYFTYMLKVCFYEGKKNLPCLGFAEKWNFALMLIPRSQDTIFHLTLVFGLKSNITLGTTIRAWDIYTAVKVGPLLKANSVGLQIFNCCFEVTRGGVLFGDFKPWRSLEFGIVLTVREGEWDTWRYCGWRRLWTSHSFHSFREATSWWTSAPLTWAQISYLW